MGPSVCTSSLLAWVSAARRLGQATAAQQAQARPWHVCLPARRQPGGLHRVGWPDLWGAAAEGEVPVCGPGWPGAGTLSPLLTCIARPSVPEIGNELPSCSVDGCPGA